MEAAAAAEEEAKPDFSWLLDDYDPKKTLVDRYSQKFESFSSFATTIRNQPPFRPHQRRQQQQQQPEQKTEPYASLETPVHVFEPEKHLCFYQPTHFFYTAESPLQTEPPAADLPSSQTEQPPAEALRRSQTEQPPTVLPSTEQQKPLRRRTPSKKQQPQKQQPEQKSPEKQQQKRRPQQQQQQQQQQQPQESKKPRQSSQKQLVFKKPVESLRPQESKKPRRPEPRPNKKKNPLHSEQQEKTKKKLSWKISSLTAKVSEEKKKTPAKPAAEDCVLYLHPSVEDYKAIFGNKWRGHYLTSFPGLQ